MVSQDLVQIQPSKNRVPKVAQLTQNVLPGRKDLVSGQPKSCLLEPQELTIKTIFTDRRIINQGMSRERFI